MIFFYKPESNTYTLRWNYQTEIRREANCPSLSHSRGTTAMNGAGFGIERPAELTKNDDEYDAYRKRMMLAYRFRPNPLVTSVSYCLLIVWHVCLLMFIECKNSHSLFSFVKVFEFNPAFRLCFHRIIHGDHITNVDDCFCLSLLIIN